MADSSLICSWEVNQEYWNCCLKDMTKILQTIHSQHFCNPKKTPATCPPSLGCSGQGEDFILRGYTMCTAQARNLEAWQSSPEFLTRPGADLDTEMVGLGGGFLMGHFGLGISETLESYGLVNELLESLELE